MQYLNIIYFIIISYYGYRFLQSDGKIVKGVLDSDQSYHYSGTELFWCLTFATGLLAFSLDIGLDLMAIRLLVLEILCIVGIKISSNKVIISFPLKLYIIYLIWILTGLFYSPNIGYGIRVVLKYLYPFLLCLCASSIVRDREVFFKSSVLARFVGVVTVLYSFIPNTEFIFPGVFWYQTARAINFISLMIFSVGMLFFTNKKRKNLFYLLIFLLPCFYWTLRTSIMGSLVAIMTFFLIKYRIKSIPLILAIIVLGIMSVFFIPTLKDKMFFDDSVTIEDFQEGKMDEENINTNTRSSMWEKLENRFYIGHEVSGSGTGAVQNYMYNNSKEFGGLTVPHSDFVQQKCDNGLIGLVLYGAIIVFIFLDCFKTYWQYDDTALKLCAIVAGASIIGVYATFYSDNVVNYSMATLSMPFGFYGMMLGLRKSKIENPTDDFF